MLAMAHVSAAMRRTVESAGRAGKILYAVRKAIKRTQSYTKCTRLITLSTRRNPSIRRCNVNRIVRHTHSYRPQPNARIARMATGVEIEFIPMPGTHHMPVLGESQAAAGLVRHYDLLDSIEQPALTDRPAMMRAAIFIGDEPVAKPEDANFQLTDCNDAIVAIR